MRSYFEQVMLADRYEAALATAGFTDVRKYKRLRRFLTRAAPTYNEVGTLHGVLSALTRGGANSTRRPQRRANSVSK